MNKTSILFAKLAALYKEIKSVLGATSSGPVGSVVREYLERYGGLLKQLKAEMPVLYLDLPARSIPSITNYIERRHLEQISRDMEYIFEVRANSELKVDVKTEETTVPEKSHRVFISHGRSPDWREVQAYIEKDLRIDTLELAQEPNKGRTVLQKLEEEADKCTFAVVIMSGDDNDVGTGLPRVRENVMHEIGFFQGKLGLQNVCLLYEEGTSIPSNIHGLVYIPFPKGLVSATFGVLGRELRAALQH